MDSLFIAASGSGVQTVSLPEWLELASIVVGSLSGLLVAHERRFDLIGFIGLALICGLGGGLIRDIMMQRGGVYMIDSPLAIAASLVTSVIVFLFPRPVERFPRLLEWIDIFAVGLFAVMGADKALVYELNPLSIVLMGTMTGVGGGMLRDVFLGDVPRIFQQSNFYAVCAVAGSAVYWAVASLVPGGKGIAVIAGVAVTVILRRLSLRFNVMLPVDVDFTPHVTSSVRDVVKHAAERIDKD